MKNNCPALAGISVERTEIPLRGCSYGRRDGMFAMTGRFSSRVYMRMFLPRDDFTRDNLQSQHNIVAAKWDGF